jgi:hypothetical protein
MATSLYTAQINQSGLQLNFVQPSGGVSFSGAVCNLLISDSAGNEQTKSCLIDPTNTFCYYVLEGSEFTASGPGNYNLQIQFMNNGDVLYSPITSLKVVGNLI